MPIHDHRCAAGHVTSDLVKAEITVIECKECGEPATRVFLTPPKIDWLGMAQGSNAGPEFKDRFDKQHRKQAEKEKRNWNEHGDYGPGVDTAMPRQPGEPDM